MTKIRTLEQLQLTLDDELTWRKRELAVIKSLVTARSSTELTNCHIRSGIALIYAHWEGFIKIETKSNLSSEVLREIAYILGLDYTEYEDEAQLIDETLLKNRNEVAHGKYLSISVEQFIVLHQTITHLLDLFSNQIKNAASTKAYRRIP
jgi:RiboL-PSP-HEPN